MELNITALLAQLRDVLRFLQLNSRHVCFDPSNSAIFSVFEQCEQGCASADTRVPYVGLGTAGMWTDYMLSSTDRQTDTHKLHANVIK
jgi:hypothetical protein